MVHFNHQNFKFELEYWFIIIKYLNFISIILNLIDISLRIEFKSFYAYNCYF